MFCSLYWWGCREKKIPFLDLILDVIPSSPLLSLLSHQQPPFPKQLDSCLRVLEKQHIVTSAHTSHNNPAVYPSILLYSYFHADQNRNLVSRVLTSTLSVTITDLFFFMHFELHNAVLCILYYLKLIQA